MGHSDERLVLWVDGRAVMEFWNITYCGHSSFRWNLEGTDQIRFGPPEPGSFGHYFQEPIAYFEVGRFTNRAGDPKDLLRVYDRGRQQEPREFFKSDLPIESYQLPKAEGG
jgi:hypothetical protein